MFPRRIVRKTIEGTAPPTGTMPPKAKSPTPSVENNPITISLTPDRLNYSELQAVEVLKAVYKDLNEISGIDTQLYSEQHTASTIPRHMLELQCQGDMREINNLMGIARKFRQVIVKGTQARKTRAQTISMLKSDLKRELGADYLFRSDSIVDTYAIHYRRIAEIFNSQGWMMFSILAHSRAFRHAIYHLTQDSWITFVDFVSENARSLEMFAKSRQLQWQKPLEWTSGLSEDDISEDEMELSEQEIGDSYQLSPICHPHEWYLPETGRPQRCCTPEGEFAVNLTESSFNIQDWALSYRPRGWPDSFDFPQDPSNFADCKELFPNPLHCRLCLTLGPCACGPAQFFNPLVELVTYKGKGRGVRTLQDIPEDTYIAEFAGEIVPNGQIDDYDLDFSLPQQGDEAGRIQSAGLIRPVIRGNFTRYINHSCDPGSEFFDAYVGGKIRQVVKTIKRVPAFTELTVHYGSTYWLEEWRSCACGEEKCEWSKEAKLKKARQIGESSKMDTSPG